MKSPGGIAVFRRRQKSHRAGDKKSVRVGRDSTFLLLEGAALGELDGGGGTRKTQAGKDISASGGKKQKDDVRGRKK